MRNIKNKIQAELNNQGRGHIQITEAEGVRISKELGASVPEIGCSGTIVVGERTIGFANNYSGIAITDLTWALEHIDTKGVMWCVNFGA